MIFNCKKLFSGGDAVDFAYSFQPDHDVLPGVPEVRVTGRFTPSSGTIRMRADVSFDRTAECDRCTVPMTNAHNFVFTHTLVIAVNEDDTDFIVLEDPKLDVDALLLSGILLELPMKTLCEEDCKGLCPFCGFNLNEGDCGCNRRTVDPRLEALKQLLQE